MYDQRVIIFCASFCFLKGVPLAFGLSVLCFAVAIWRMCFLLFLLGENDNSLIGLSSV